MSENKFFKMLSHSSFLVASSWQIYKQKIKDKLMDKINRQTNKWIICYINEWIKHEDTNKKISEKIK